MDGSLRVSKSKADTSRVYGVSRRSMISGLWKRPFRHCFQPRKFHAFSIGALTSGNHTIANLLNSRYRVEHEPTAQLLNKLIIDCKQDNISERDIRRFFQLRDINIWLELESNSFNFYFADYLLELFPKAKFILPLQNPGNWLDTWINYTIANRTQRGSLWESGIKAIFNPELYEYDREESVFRRYNLLPISCYLNYWLAHNLKVINSVPAHRLLILSTRHIRDSALTIAEFLNIPGSDFNTSVAGKTDSSFTPNAFKPKVLQKLDPAFLNDTLHQYHHNKLGKYLELTKNNFTVSS
ncbi:MAG: hypothetical protein P8Y42_08935 [Exilibacterium sp.]